MKLGRSENDSSFRTRGGVEIDGKYIKDDHYQHTLFSMSDKVIAIT